MTYKESEFEWDAGDLGCGDLLVLLSMKLRRRPTGTTFRIHEAGFSPLRELMANFVEAGGKIYVCAPCFKRRSLDKNNLVSGATIVGGAKLVEFLSGGSPCISY